MTALLSLNSGFSNLHVLPEKRVGWHCFSRTFSVVKELTVLNYREAVSFILPKTAPTQKFRYENEIQTFSVVRK